MQTHDNHLAINATVRDYHEANRQGWNEGAAHYTEGLEKTLASLRAGHSSLHPIERAHLGDLRAWCGTAIHLQCASGEDTLSLWLEGAQRVVGVDSSDVHIANARQLSAMLNAPAVWYRCDALDTPHELDGEADLVYTGQGALCWLHDLTAWAQVIYRLLKPGGVFHVLDDHPITWLFDLNAETYVLTDSNYFTYEEHSRGWPSSYIGTLAIPLEEQTVKHERVWPIASVFQALRQAGLIVDYLGEHVEPYWNVFPNLKAELRGKIPLTFSIKAYRP
jgi:SAM-dependent methyltransferase